MNVLVVSREFPPYTLGGISYHLSHLYSEISDDGHNVTVLAGAASETYDSNDVLPESEIDIHPISYGAVEGGFVKFPIALYRKLRQFDYSKYDIAFIHTQIPFSLNIPTVSKFHGVPRIERKYNSPESIFGSYLYRTAGRISEEINRIHMRHSDFIIFNSELTANMWMSQYSPPERSQVIYNGVDHELFFPRDVPQSDYLIHVGDQKRKGTDRVIEYARNVDDNIKIIGDLSDRDLPPNVSLLGRVSQDRLAELYSGARATIHPARFEAFGNVILESLSCGTPVVVSPNCGAAEIINTGGVVTCDLADGLNQIESITKRDCVNDALEYSWASVADKTLAFARSMI